MSKKFNMKISNIFHYFMTLKIFNLSHHFTITVQVMLKMHLVLTQIKNFMLYFVLY